MLIKDSTYNKTLDTLRSMAEKGGAFPEIVRLYLEVLTMQVETHVNTPCGQREITNSQASALLVQGTPLLSFADFSPDWYEVSRLFAKLSKWAEDSQDFESGKSGDRNIDSNRSTEIKELARKWYENSPGFAPAPPDSQDKLSPLVGTALKPFLVKCSRLLSPLVDSKIWRRSYCPVCGGKADFAYLEKETGARFLVCARCDTEWLFLRLKCPYCGTQNQDKLGYFSIEGEPYRMYVCRECHTYIKTLDLRLTTDEVLIPLERAVTLELDRKAIESGYKPG
ncbi:MAG: formate dehydrogenase accessory protein FdhE [Chloroflexota bacterium]